MEDFMWVLPPLFVEKTSFSNEHKNVISRHGRPAQHESSCAISTVGVMKVKPVVSCFGGETFNPTVRAHTEP